MLCYLHKPCDYMHTQIPETDRQCHYKVVHKSAWGGADIQTDTTKSIITQLSSREKSWTHNGGFRQFTQDESD